MNATDVSYLMRLLSPYFTIGTKVKALDKETLAIGPLNTSRMLDHPTELPSIVARFQETGLVYNGETKEIEFPSKT